MMQRYEKYKDSGVEWIGEIPEGWEVKKLKRLSTIRRGASPRPIADPKYFDNLGEWAWVRIADVSASERYLESTTQTLSELGASLSVKMLPNSFFLSIAGTVGKPIITKIQCCIHDGFVYFISLNLNPEFLYYIFSTGQPYKGLGKLGTQLNLNTDTVGDITIPIPCTNAIESIISYLDRKTAEIDQLITQKEALISLYEEEKTAIINQAVTQGINPDVKLKESGIDWLGEIPEHWGIKKIKFIISHLESGVSVNSTDFPATDKSYGILKTSCVYEYIFEPSKNKEIWQSELIRAKIKPRKGEIIISRMNTPELVGASGYVDKDYEYLYLPDRLWQTVFRIGITIDTKWLSYVLKSIRFRMLLSFTATGSSPSMKNLTQEDFMKITIPFPVIDEQTAIVKHIETQVTRINAKISKTKKIIALQKEYRTALISEVVTGKIKVTQEMIS